MKMLEIDLNQVERVAICGNPIQLSMFQNMEVRDLAFAMPNALKSRGIDRQKRDAIILNAVDLGLDLPEKVQVLLPPAIKHEMELMPWP